MSVLLAALPTLERQHQLLSKPSCRQAFGDGSRPLAQDHYAMRSILPRASTFSLVTSSPSGFFSAPATAPRTVWLCQPVAAAISAWKSRAV